MREALHDRLRRFDSVSLKALDNRAALLRRVDTKYAVPMADFTTLLQRLDEGHQVLEIDGGRIFDYSTTYFDTPELRCFVDHVEGHAPRFKARSRLYEDTGECVFEVKLKRSDGETDKRQIDYQAHDRERLTEDALECVRTALAGTGLTAPQDLEATLTTSFARVTLVAREGSERVTCDLNVRVVGRDDETAEMRPELVLVETKSESGQSPADEELARLDISSISLSKYRVGMSLVGAARRFGAQPGSDLFG